MTEENLPTPNAPKQSIFKRSRFGLISLALDILVVAMFVVDYPALIGSTTYVPFPLAGAFLFLVPGAIIALIGLSADRQKGASIAGLILSLVLGCILIGLVVFVIYGFVNQFH
jgi:hypothetical protein